jgi:hypothetical protein
MIMIAQEIPVPPIPQNENDLSWPMKVLIAIDQLGNAIADGNPDVTISARVGEFARRVDKNQLFWRTMESIINLAFLPVDGPDHCYNAFKDEPGEKETQGNDVARAILCTFVLVFCPIIFIVLRLAIFFVPEWGYEPQGYGSLTVEV